MADDDAEWRFTPDGEPADAPDADPFDADPEPGSPSFENAFFVLLGVAATVAVFAITFL
ncbi:hypothetical protein ACFQPA_09160 [Halomarina halobia]|uniref:DUF7312 domain-containing protein n=1 Tax=Halomarina halobia TaxID=3033386 RepID=A0ABD6ABL4_9EURY|nr:hypothetical protein [Halomarina sp. PSR21]